MKAMLWLALLGASLPAWGKPISYAGSSMVMLEVGTALFTEAQAYFSPRFDRSFGGGHLRQTSDVSNDEREITYLRGNALLRRWNLPGAQGNVFAGFGLGRAYETGWAAPRTAYNASFEADYETRRIYVSAKHDWHGTPGLFSDRMTTLQAGVAPYPHDWDVLATWLVLQARRFTPDMREDRWQGAALLRFFKRNVWLEVGVAEGREALGMLMITF